MSPQLPPAPTGHPIIKHGLQFARGPFEFVDYATTECGDAYRMDLPGIRDVFVLGHPDYFKQALMTKIDAFGKTEDYRRAFGSGLLSVEGNQWRRQREVLQPLFYRDQIKRYTDQMVTVTDRRLALWEEGDIRDVETEMRDLTLEILFATVFGRKLIPGDDAELRDAADGLNDWFAPSSWMLPRWVPTPARRRFNRSTKRLRREVRRLLSEGEVNPRYTDDGQSESQREGSGGADESTLDLLTQLQRAGESDEGVQLTTQEIEDQLVTMVFAGHETTAAALAFTWYLLANHPNVREEFHEELDTVLGGDPPSHRDLSELEVTNRIITEAIRLYPPVHTIPRQTTTDVEVDGFLIPDDHEVHLSIIHVHRHKDFYHRPMSFVPDRWTDEFQEELHDFAYLPFGGGRRTCIGREFALLEAKVVLATIGQAFRLEWDSDKGLALSPRVTTRTKDGISLRVHRR